MNFFDKLKDVRIKFFLKSTALQSTPSGGSIRNKEGALPYVSASITGTLTPYNLVVLISASSNVPGAYYYWKGPLGFTSRQQKIFVTEPGTYTVTVTNPANGGSNNTSVVVKEPEPLIDDIKQHQLDLIHILKESKINRKKRRNSASAK